MRTKMCKSIRLNHDIKSKVRQAKTKWLLGVRRDVDPIKTNTIFQYTILTYKRQLGIGIFLRWKC